MITLAATLREVIGGAFAGIAVLVLLGCAAIGSMQNWNRKDQDDDHDSTL